MAGDRSNADPLNIDYDFREALDTDGDNVHDEQDIDDDNDGILDIVENSGGLPVVPDFFLNADPASPNYVVSSIFNSAHNTPQLDSVQGWSALTSNTSQFIGMLFDEPLSISSVTTQGRANSNQWVTSYQLEATKDGVTWELSLIHI